MKPIIILPPGIMSEQDIAELRGNDLCVVVAEDPAKVRFLDPIPASSNRDRIEDAAIALSRKILHGQLTDNNNNMISPGLARRQFIEILLNGTPMSATQTQEEMEHRAYDQARIEEAMKIAREDARAEREKLRLEKEVKDGVKAASKGKS